MMYGRFRLIVGSLVLGFATLGYAQSLQRIGHTTLTPRHTSPDDKGMYTALIDPTSGYAYFVGTYLSKLDITGDLPVPVGTNLFTGQYTESAIDPAAGYMYFSRTTVDRYALGAGTNSPSPAGSLTLLAGHANSVVIDDSDPNPTNHYAYVLCTVSGGPARVAKVALATFSELGSVSLNAGETNFWFGRADPSHGYAYFGSFPNSNIPQVVKIKFTPGTNAPQRIGVVNLDTVVQFLDGASIDTLHGYAYYGTYNSDTNVPSRVYKVKLGDGDAPPMLVGSIDLKPGEGRLAASVCDPRGGYVYFADDNSYPGSVYQLAINGTNPPIETARLFLQGGPNTNTPPNGMTAANTTTNADGVLPFGEIFFRSAVFDPIHGFAYLGQDSRPNQVVKIQLEVDPPVVTGTTALPDGTFQVNFTYVPGVTFTALASSDLSVPVTNWTVLGAVNEISPGQFQFIDPQATNSPQHFYRGYSH